MNIHEYQAKKIFTDFGAPTPRGRPCFSLEEAHAAVDGLAADGCKVFVVKAQIHAGGRGKGGGVKVAKSADEAKEYAAQIFGMTLITRQTGPGGRVVKRLLIEEGADIASELYLAIVLDRAKQRPALMTSSEGGMDIEEVAAATPEKIHKVWMTQTPVWTTTTPARQCARLAWAMPHWNRRRSWRKARGAPIGRRTHPCWR